MNKITNLDLGEPEGVILSAWAGDLDITSAFRAWVLDNAEKKVDRQW